LLITACLLSLVASYEAGNTACYSVAVPSILSVWCGVFAETEGNMQLFLPLPVRLGKEPASYMIHSCLISYNTFLNNDDWVTCVNLMVD